MFELEADKLRGPELTTGVLSDSDECLESQGRELICDDTAVSESIENFSLEDDTGEMVEAYSELGTLEMDWIAIDFELSTDDVLDQSGCELHADSDTELSVK